MAGESYVARGPSGRRSRRPLAAPFRYAHRGCGRGAQLRQALAEENGWSLERALEVSREYRRFLFLAAGGGPELTPSRAVDKAWHLHLTYSRHYWDVLCKEILGKPLHHEPAAGHASDDALHADQYERTLALYEATFGPAPTDIWPRPTPSADEAPETRQRHEGRCSVSGGGGCATSSIEADSGGDDGSAGCGSGCGGGCGGS